MQARRLAWVVGVLVLPHSLFYGLASIPWADVSSNLNSEQIPWLVSMFLTFQVTFFFPVAVLNIQRRDQKKLWVPLAEPFLMASLVFVLTTIVPYLMDKYPVPFLLWAVGPFLWSVLAVYLSARFYREFRSKLKKNTPVYDIMK
ncbi:MAG: hypothetical protein SGCHY_004324, partial [Lobulomycetales sp.]